MSHTETVTGRKVQISGSALRESAGKRTSNYASGLFCCFIKGVAGMSRDLGWDVPDLEKLYARKLWADLNSYLQIDP